ncbi:hypothetical protein DFH08DRAFT_997623 [Mycena albidolilacea]|uniref:Uncharacterized protein n=1 Tax=Mycena albidolilacea TaxID=1033008 RepID=A0AAD6YXE6_9AGAR|nr:hypothetical protein DFH08DRAFT_997623 [Mycena albidolilacea]
MTVAEINQPDRLAPPRVVESLVVDTPSRGVPAGRSRSVRERGGADRGRGRGRGRGAAMLTINQPEVPVPPQADDGRGRGRGRGRAERRPRATGRGGLGRGVDNGRMGSSNIGGIEGDSRGDEFSGRGGGHGKTEGRGSGQIPRPQSPDLLEDWREEDKPNRETEQFYDATVSASLARMACCIGR